MNPVEKLNTRLRASRLGRFLGVLAQPTPKRRIALAEALPWLVPKVRPRFEYEAFRLRTGRAPVHRPLAGAFAQSLVVDLPDQEVDLEPEDLAAWNADFDALLQRARRNLLARGGEERFRRLGPGRYRSTWQDNLDGSRVLLPGVLRQLELEGEPVVLLPDRDTLLVVGSEDPAGLAWALEAALECLDALPRSLNGCPLRLRGFEWEPLRVRSGHPALPLLRRVERRRLRDEYAHQKSLLDRQPGVLGRAIDVAPFRLVPSASVAVLSRPQGESWLPKADRVGLDWAGGRAEVPWEQVQEHLEPVAGLFPERFRCTGAARLLA